MLFAMILFPSLSYGGGPFTFSDDPRLIYTFKPNTQGTNSQGYFDNEHSHEKENGVYRITVIGDSIAQGQGVLIEESFPRILEEKLNQNPGNKKYEIIVLARTGYSTSQEMVLFKEEAFLYDPDLIIWSYVLNDPAHPVFHDANGELGRHYYKPKNATKHYIEKKQFILKEKLKGRECPKEFHAFLQCAYWDNIVKDVKEIGAVIHRKKIPLIFVIHPVFEKDKNFHQYSLIEEHHKLAELALQEGLVPLDLLDVFKPHNPLELKQTGPNPGVFDPWHPNARGHYVIAEALIKAVKEITGKRDRSR